LEHLPEFATDYGKYPGRMVYLATSTDAFNQIRWDSELVNRCQTLSQFRENRLVLIRSASANPAAGTPLPPPPPPAEMVVPAGADRPVGTPLR
jgi:hypothetical protein